MGGGSKRSFEAIDLLRFLSAAGVVAYHYGSAYGRMPNGHAASWPRLVPLPESWLAMSWWGWIGVELFFVISGCVIAGSARGATPGGFAGRRLARLFPAAWVCASLTLAVLLVTGASGPLFTQWLGAFTLWPMGPWIDGVYWTLGVELAFYWLVAVLLARGAGDRLEGLAQGLAVASLLYWLVLASGLLPAGWIHPRIADLLLLTHGCFFALGIHVRAALDHGLTRRRAAAMGLCLIPAALEIVAHGYDLGPALGLAGTPTVPLAVFLAGLLVMLGADRLQPYLERWLPAGLAARLGLATYPLYLLHQEAGAAVLSRLVRSGMPATLAALVVGAAMLAAALAISAFAEPWLRRGLSRLAAALRSALFRFRPVPIFLGEHAER
ncbi:acyltransferase [Sphingomonas sp. R-74633]|uniref:acyltransferase family protein n=1 Tax=Sphingomonas sp. R-74633 TaxID=2751188 RepID=UPI0015D3E4FD|nr:acyltransferase [Sphingomonas sp. R-74633]NYT41149.1 acyltransferase [Sphingomonas sp. R-74633]